MTTPIPQPPTIPFLGNAKDVEKEVPIRSYHLLAERYGEIYQLNMAGNLVYNVNSWRLVNEISDEKRFKKLVAGELGEVRHMVGDGLFTAQLEEHNWQVAHRMLMPAFGPAGIRGMIEDMRDICSQLILKWERFGPHRAFAPMEDYTRLTFDTIAFCTMSVRLNSFYTDEFPPFVQAMADVLFACHERSLRPAIVQMMMIRENAQYYANIKLMQDFAQNIIDERKAHPSTKKDLLDTMLEGRDTKTGAKMEEENIMNNLITFLVAGHETTSALLSFSTFFLLKNPDKMRILREEIDTVCGTNAITLDHISRMPYLTAVLRETLRLAPSAPKRGVVALEDTVIGGQYAVKANTPIVLHVSESMRDPSIYGEDANEFKPERLIDGEFQKLPPNAWQPFGYGLRGCIGRPFAWQEAQLVLASVIQKFDLFLADPSYTLDLKQTLTIKPASMKIRAVPRAGRTIASVVSSVSGSAEAEFVSGEGKEEGKHGGEEEKGARLYVLYGGNTGTCESFASRIAVDAPEHGFSPVLGTLDSVAGQLPTDGPVIIITASFEGEPADNAAQFVDWLTHLSSSNPLTSVKFALFGCGNREWARTYQRIPTLCDTTLVEKGAERLIERGEGDAASMTFFQDFEVWEGRVWEKLQPFAAKSTKSTQGLGITIMEVGSAVERARLLRQDDMGVGEVVVNRKLTGPNVPVKFHIEFKLPEGMTYQAGDYLALLPVNPPATVKRVLTRFGFSAEQVISISSDYPTTLPVDRPLTIDNLLGDYVELTQIATTRDIQSLISSTSNDATKSALQTKIDNYENEIVAKRIGVLDLLEEFPDIALEFAEFLKMLPAMRVRQYSISSSSLQDPKHATLTISVIDAPAISGRGNQRYLGAASNYLAGLEAGEKVQMIVRSSAVSFHPPSDPSVPMILCAVGSGLAPFRGFIEERAIQKASGRKTGRVLLFYGCRLPEEDYLYWTGELGEWEKTGVVEVRPAFSRKPGTAEGCKYVQDRIWADRADITECVRAGAKVFTCGSRKAANGIKDAFVKIIQANRKELNAAEAEEAFEKIRKERYATDIFD